MQAEDGSDDNANAESIDDDASYEEQHAKAGEEPPPIDMAHSMQLQRERRQTDDGLAFLVDMEMLYQLWWRWADFHLYITSPVVNAFQIRRVVSAELIEDTDAHEFVYPIVDYGDHFSTSKALEFYTAGMSMHKLYCTIEKIISLFVDRLKSQGITTDQEVQIAFSGHELAQRKGFESVINLSYNVVVTNFDPGEWGEKYLQLVKGLAEKGYGYPEPAPRNTFRHPRLKTLSKTR